MRRNLVTGGAGFIGSHLVEHLLARGESVVALDDLSTGSFRNLEQASSHPGFRFRFGSALDTDLVVREVDCVDRVFHLAAAVGVKRIVESPVLTLQTNIRGTEVLLEAAARRQTPLLLASTSEVYGKGSRVPFSENDDLVYGPTSKARWCYGASKAVDEFLGLAYFRERALPCVVARMFNTVGPRQTGRYGMVLPRFIEQALAGGPLTVYGDGSQTRCFSHVADIIGALDQLCGRASAAGRVFNLGSSEEVSIRELAERVRAAVRPEAAVVSVPYEDVYGEGFEDIERRVPDLRRIRDELGFAPSRNLDAIIAELRQEALQGQGDG